MSARVRALRYLERVMNWLRNRKAGIPVWMRHRWGQTLLQVADDGRCPNRCENGAPEGPRQAWNSWCHGHHVLGEVGRHQRSQLRQHWVPLRVQEQNVPSPPGDNKSVA
jgi:hypothetical protein